MTMFMCVAYDVAFFGFFRTSSIFTKKAIPVWTPEKLIMLG